MADELKADVRHPQTIPIVFAIDDNVVVPCAVTLTSLLKNSRPETSYQVFILYEEAGLSAGNRERLSRSFHDSYRQDLCFMDVGDAFSDVPQMQRVTKATYYRLLIPTLFPQYDKIIYSDIDIIFQQDLSELFAHSFPNGELIAAVLDQAIDREFYFSSTLPAQIGKSVEDYFNAGFLLMNLKRLRAENKMEEFQRLSKQKFPQNDQDVLNIVCNGRVQWLPSMYNFQTNHYANYMWGRDRSDIDFTELVKKATLHYTFRNKPWSTLECSLSDAWWHYYRLSPLFDNAFYFQRQYRRIEAARNDYHNAKSKTLIIQLLGRLKKRIRNCFHPGK